jgi:hypothetical protein
LLDMQAQEQKAIKATMDLEAAQKKHGEDLGKPKAESPMRGFEDQLNQIKQLVGPSQVTADDEARFWNEKLALAKKGTTEYSEILARATQAQAEADRKRVEQAKTDSESLMTTFSETWRAQEELDKQAVKSSQDKIEADKRSHEQMLQMLAGDTEATVKFAERQEAAAEKLIAFQEKMGQKSPHQAEQDRLNASQTSQDKQIGALSTEQSQYDRYQGGAQLAKWKELENEMTAISQKGEIDRAQITQQYLLQQQQKYNQYFQQVDNQFNNTVDIWLRGGERMSAAWAKAADDIALSTINSLLKMGEKWLEHEILVRVLHTQTAAQQAATDAAAAATAQSTAAAANVAQALSYAAVAAAAAAAAVAGIPVVGPALAPAAAATVYATTSVYAAMAAYETGADLIPKTGLAFLHEGERVLDRDSNRQITRAMTGRGNDDRGGSGGIHFHDNSSWSGIDGASVEGMFRSHGAAMRREMMRQLRLNNRI